MLGTRITVYICALNLDFFNDIVASIETSEFGCCVNLARARLLDATTRKYLGGATAT